MAVSKTLPEVIMGVRNSPPWDSMAVDVINNGYCDDFADAVRRECAACDVPCSVVTDEAEHVWLKSPLTGSHHDIETPNGVPDHQQLHFFQPR